MLEYRPGYLVKSLAGHDKDRYFIILKEDGEYVWLADGKLRTVEAPKKKKKKHLQLVNELLLPTFPVKDEMIRSVMKDYKRSHCGI